MQQQMTTRLDGPCTEKASVTDQSLINLVNRLQTEVIELRNVLEPYLNPSSPVPQCEAEDRPQLSALEGWLRELTDATDISLKVVADIRERLYTPNVLAGPQPIAPQGKGNV